MNRYFKITRDDGRRNVIVAAPDLTNAAYQYETELLRYDSRIKPQEGMVTISEISYDLVSIEIRRTGSTVLFTRNALTDDHCRLMYDHGFKSSNNSWGRRGVEFFGAFDGAYLHIGQNTTLFDSCSVLSEALNSLRSEPL